MAGHERHYEIMRELMELPGPTGQEGPVMDWLRERWQGRVEELWTAKGGNLFARVGGSGPKLLVEGHADEIGFVVRSVDEQGFVWLAGGQASRGDIARRYPVGQPALIVGRDATVATRWSRALSRRRPATAWLSASGRTSGSTTTTCSSMSASLPAPRPRTWASTPAPG